VTSDSELLFVYLIIGDVLDLNPDLTGRTVLVTGSSKRVGREVLLNLADAGADVAVHYRE